MWIRKQEIKLPFFIDAMTIHAENQKQSADKLLEYVMWIGQGCWTQSQESKHNCFSTYQQCTLWNYNDKNQAIK